LLLNFKVKIDRVESTSKAYVNKGGIQTLELKPKSMESKKVPGLYFIGETVDVHGPIGGYNITIAFSTGYAAAQDIKKKYH
jgi:predicted flavoprotein YhiN